jgi:energy-coupling factor transporter ATP-binding protein EcfA2
MKTHRNIIISGPKGSGKSRLANIISGTHENAIETSAGVVKRKIENGDIEIKNLPFRYDLIIIDECQGGDIRFLDDNFRLNWPKDPWNMFEQTAHAIKVIYITQDHVSADPERFDVINLK